jgi:hypothetical protein
LRFGSINGLLTNDIERGGVPAGRTLHQEENMAPLRVVTLDTLLERLRATLGEDSLLVERFARAFATRDAELVAAVLDGLDLYPGFIKDEVEDVILGWLFGPAETSILAHLEPASPARH